MDDTGKDLLKAVIESPEEDSVRLIFADWLEDDHPDRDPDRAELIRASVKFAGMTPPVATHENIRYDHEFRYHCMNNCGACIKKGESVLRHAHGGSLTTPVEVQ